MSNNVTLCFYNHILLLTYYIILYTYVIYLLIPLQGNHESITNHGKETIIIRGDSYEEKEVNTKDIIHMHHTFAIDDRLSCYFSK